MSRLKKANHVGDFIHKSVEKDIKDLDRSKKRSSAHSYLLAKQLIMDTTISPTNENLQKLSLLIDEGKFVDVGSSDENWQGWIKRTNELFHENKTLLAKKNNKK